MLTTKIQAAKNWLLLICLLLVLTGCTPPGPRALLEGKKLLDSGKAQAAAEKIKEATGLMPTNALAFNYLGLACHQAGRVAEAERAYVRALALNHEMAEVHFNLGCLLLEQNRLEQAKSEFTAFTLRRSNAPEGYLKLGTAQLRSREPAAAERSLNEALRLSPGNPEALTGIGLAKYQRNRASEAMQYFSKALQEQPGYRPALLNLAILAQEHLRDKQLAVKTYKQLLALKPPPENAGAIQSIVRNLEQELNPPLAAPQLPATNTVAQSLQPAPRQEAVQPVKKPLAPVAQTSVPPQVELAAGASKPVTQTNFTKPTAQTNWVRPIPHDGIAKPTTAQSTTNPAAAPPPMEIVSLSGEPVLKLGQDPTPPTPAPVKRGAGSMAPETTTVSSNKMAKHGLFQKLNPVRLFSSDEKTQPSPSGQVTAPPASATNEPAAAPPKTFTRYAYRNPAKPAAGNHADAERAYAQGVQAHQSQRLPEAMQAYRRAIQLDPAFFNAYYNLALAATESGNLQTALSTYETALALRPDYQEARYNFALVLKQSNFPVDAASELEKILSNFPNDSRAHLALGNLYAQQLGNARLARQHYLKVLEIDPRNPQSANIHYWLTEHPK